MMRSLRVFCMTQNRVTGRLPKSIVNMKRLRHFDVSENSIDKQSAQELREGLSSLKLLVSFNVGGSSELPSSPEETSAASAHLDDASAEERRRSEDWSTGEGVKGNSFRARRVPAAGATDAVEGGIGLRKRGSGVVAATPQTTRKREAAALELA